MSTVPPGSDEAPPERPIGFWLTLLGRLVDEQFAVTLHEHGVTRRQWQLLNLLSSASASVAELDAQVAPFLDQAAGETSADHLGELVESGWVTLDASTYALTDRGRMACTRLAVVVADYRTLVGDGVSDEEYATTVRVLERMARNLGWTEG